MTMALLREIREQFPQLQQLIRGRRLVYLDSAATTLKPRRVIEAVHQHLSFRVANVHRGAHFLSDEATECFENVREQVRAYLGAESKSEIIFTRGTTESLNLLASGLAASFLNEGDEILLSQMEHHSNIVPWQMAAAKRKALVRFIPVLDDGTLDFVAFKKMLSQRTKIVSLVHLSNVLGTVNPLASFFREARSYGALCVADVAQSVSTQPNLVADLDCDFLAFSGHKMFAPTGVGVLYGRYGLLEKLPPYQGGGSMISEVREDGFTVLPPPHRFEAGTPSIAEVVALGAAIDFINEVGFDFIHSHERMVTNFAEECMARVAGIECLGISGQRSHVLSFLLAGQHPSDVGAILDEQGVAVRAGHHCCQPLMRSLEIPGTVRASFSVYTSEEDINDLLNAISKAKDMLS